MGCARRLLLHARRPVASLAPTHGFANGDHCSAWSGIPRRPIDGNGEHVRRAHEYVAGSILCEGVARFVGNVPGVVEHACCFQTHAVFAVS
jgi:hypothetical protein